MYNYRKVIEFIATEGAVSTKQNDPNLSQFPGIYSNVSVRPVLCSQFIGRYFNYCNAIDNYNRMRQSDIALEKYWVTYSVYFILETTVTLRMDITDQKLLYWHGVSEVNVHKYFNTGVQPQDGLQLIQ